MADPPADAAPAGPPPGPIISSVQPGDLLSRPPEFIGPYRILELVGQGGMGEVYRAQQERPIRRIVAIKVIKLGMDTREIVARFEAERQALALMDHPCIAKVFDAGATETGRPYFAMEWVAGEPITSWCDKRRLSLRTRLELFARVCEAVQHAHGKGIIHRDLKPSNVLVSETDGEPMPRVIDFGVAKAAGPRLTERSLFTEQGRLIGTPEYMSPEQAEMSFVDVDTRSDIYSLGVILYELLSGRLPFESGELRGGNIADVQRLIREVDPPRPSNRLTAKTVTRDQLADVARDRGTEPGTLTRQLRDELEWIPLKAMRKDPAQRYRTATELADDIRNYLAGRPLIAGPETARYRARKFLRRNRGAVAAAAGLLALLLAGVATTSWQAVRATRAQRLAQQGFNDVRELAHTFIFEFDPKIEYLPGATPARRLIVRTALDYLQKLEKAAAGAGAQGRDPALQRELAGAYERIADIQSSVAAEAGQGGIGAAVASAKTAVDLFTKLADADTANSAAQLDLADAHRVCGELLRNGGDIHGAAEQFALNLRILARLAAANPTDAAIARQRVEAEKLVGDVTWFMGEKAQGLQLMREAADRAERLAAEHPDDPRVNSELTSTYQYLGDAYFNEGDYRSALAIFRKSLAIGQSLSQRMPGSADVRRNLALALQRVALTQERLGKPDDALASLEQDVRICRELAEVDPTNLSAKYNYATAIGDQGRSQLARGQASAAVATLAQGVQIARDMHEADPNDGEITLKFVDLQLGHAEALLASGDSGAAAAEAGPAAALACDLADASPKDSERQGPALAGLTLLGRATEAMAKSASADDRARYWQAAADAYAKALSRGKLLDSRGMLDSDEQKQLQELLAALRRCAAAGATTPPD